MILIWLERGDPPVCFDKYLHWFFSIHSKLPHTIKNHEADYPPPTYWTLDIWSISSCISTLPGASGWVGMVIIRIKAKTVWLYLPTETELGNIKIL